jgi:hypothetical protein
MRSIGLGRCPYCNSDDVYRSRSRSVLDKLAHLVLLRPVRCHGCMRRHFTPILFQTKRRVARVNAKPPQNTLHPTPARETRKSA